MRIPPRLRSSIAPLAVLAAFSTAASADEQTTATFSGFGTIGAVRHGADGAEFRRDLSTPAGAKAHKWSFDQDSMLGIQATARHGEQLEATLQLVSRYAIDSGYAPQVTWAFVKFKPSEDVTLRAGRLAIEMYLQGDSAEIGYANLLVRQPLIFYPRLMQGADAEWIVPAGDGTLRFKGQFGDAVGKLASGGVYDASGSHGTILLVEYTRDSWTARAAVGRLSLKNELADANSEALFQALTAVPNGRQLMSALSMKRDVDYRSLGLAYDSGPLQAMGGYTEVASANWSKERAFFVQAGYRIGELTPYAAYSRQRTRRDFVQTGIPWGLTPTADALNQAVLVAQSLRKTNQSTASLGVRYDVSRNMALKLQVDDIHYQDPSSIVDSGQMLDDVAARGYRRMNLYSAALEFVF